MVACLCCLSLSLKPEMHLSDFRKEKIHKKTPSKKPPLVCSSLKCINFSIPGHHFLELQPDQKARKEERRFHWRKPGFFWGGGGVGRQFGEMGVVLEKEMLLNINGPTSLLLMEKHLTKWHHFTFCIPAGLLFLCHCALHTDRKTKPFDSLKTSRI